MLEHTDLKGKYFSNLVYKDQIKVSIRTPSGCLEGYLHIQPNLRLKDVLNNDETFIALTDGNIGLPGGQGSKSFDFLALNKDQIIFVIEEEREDELDPNGESL